jgi:glycosyltransferase involved in cell wall biosynthesis
MVFSLPEVSRAPRGNQYRDEPALGGRHAFLGCEISDHVRSLSRFAPWRDLWGDEPLEDVLQAADQLPDVHFFITGDTRRKPDSFIASAPSNVTFTGYLKSDSQYIGLLRAVDAIMALTTRNYTLQLAGCEAVSVGKPLITSDWPCLQELFAKGTVFVANSADSIRDGVLIMQDRHKELAREISTLRQDRRKEWDIRLVQLKESVVTK